MTGLFLFSYDYENDYDQLAQITKHNNRITVITCEYRKREKIRTSLPTPTNTFDQLIPWDRSTSQSINRPRRVHLVITYQPTN